MSELRQQFERYAQHDGKPLNEKALQEMELEQFREEFQRWKTGQAPSPTSGGTPVQTQPAVDYLKVFEAVGVDPANNEVIQLATRHAQDANALSAALVQWKINKGQQPSAPASAVAPPPGGVSAASDDQKATNLMNELAALSQNPSKNIKRIQELNKELRQLTG